MSLQQAAKDAAWPELQRYAQRAELQIMLDKAVGMGAIEAFREVEQRARAEGHLDLADLADRNMKAAADRLPAAPNIYIYTYIYI